MMTRMVKVTLEYFIDIEADSAKEAERKVQEQLANGDILLGPDYCDCYSIKDNGEGSWDD